MKMAAFWAGAATGCGVDRVGVFSLIRPYGTGNAAAAAGFACRGKIVLPASVVAWRGGKRMVNNQRIAISSRYSL